MELKVNEIKRKNKQKDDATLNETKGDSTKDIEENVEYILAKADDYKGYSTNTISLCGEKNPADVVEGTLNIIWPRKDFNQVLEVPLYMHGIEAWLVNVEDYQTLLEVMQSWEEQNMDYIQDLSQNMAAGLEYTQNNEDDSQSQLKKKKKMPGDYNFGSDNDSEEIEGAGFDMDQMMRNKQKQKKNEGDSGLIIEKHICDEKKADSIPEFLKRL